MNRLRYCIITLFLLLGINKSFSQLSGAYTVGGTNPDYATPLDALYAMDAQGVSGCVIFNIRPGTYSGFGVGAVPNLAYPDSVIFQSETHDSTDVILTCSSGTMTFFNCSAITVKWLTLQATGSTCLTGYTVDIRNGNHCNVLNCILSAPTGTGLDEYEASVSIRQSNNAGSYVTVANCSFTGTCGGVNVLGAETSTFINILNNQVLCTGTWGIYNTDNCRITVNDNVFLGEVYIKTSTTNGVFFNTFNNNRAMGLVRTSGFTQVRGNVFLYTNHRNEFASTLIKGNYFAGEFSNIRSGSVISNNVFEGNVSISSSTGTIFTNNNLTGSLFLNNCGHSKIAYNDIKGGASISSSDNCSLYGNLFYDMVDLNGSNNKVYYNNFSAAAILRNNYNKMDVRYNNLSQNPDVKAGSTVLYNNYFPIGGEKDLYPTQYNPQYVSDSNIRAQNPLLIGKGTSFAAMSVDIDSLKRPYFPTIGANEICIATLHALDSIQLICGDKIQLKICSSDSNSRYTCLQPAGLTDSLSFEPYAIPRESAEYYLLDSAGNKIDSAFIIVTGLTPVADDSIGSCTQKVLLNGSYCQGAVYDWTPGEGLSDSTSAHTSARPLTTTTYIEKVSIPGCNTFWDTVVIKVDYLPTAAGGCIFTGDTLKLINNSICADSIHCNFGDGETVNISPFTPWVLHEYDTPGIYTVLITACNQFGCDTFTSIIPISFATDVEELSLNSVYLYPNPTTNQLTIQTSAASFSFQILSTTGQLLMQNSVTQQPNFTIDVSTLPAGLYFLQLNYGKQRVVKKFVKE